MTSKHSGGMDQSESSAGGRSIDAAHEPKRTSEESRKGMQHGDHPASKTQHPDAEKSHQGGNFANNPDKASEAGRKGGQHSHGGSSGGSTK
jgi:general stress protein YciG